MPAPSPTPLMTDATREEIRTLVFMFGREVLDIVVKTLRDLDECEADDPADEPIR